MEKAVFEAGAVPRRRKASQRRLSVKCCLTVIGAIGATLAALALILVARALPEIIQNITSPHGDLVHRPENGNADHTVKPLVNATAHFDIRATVWLDVTDHASQGKALPHDMQVVRYKQPNGVQRSEAILHSSLLFQNASTASRLHSSVKIRVPVEPLYSQPLGPSTLRATFQLVPREVSPTLCFNSSRSIYSPFLPIGPRSPQSMLLTSGGEEGDDAAEKAPSTLDEALERSAINVNLLALLNTNLRDNSTEPNLRSDYNVGPPMFDGTPGNRAFSKDTNASNRYFVDEEHRIWLPHLRTRSRIILLNEQRNYSISSYADRLKSAKQSLETSCKVLEDAGSNMTADGQCQRPFASSLFENALTFTEEGLEDDNHAAAEQLFYAPFLTQQLMSCAYRHHRTIPRQMPGANLTKTPGASQAKDERCLIPMLQTDDSQQFFEFDWVIFFSSHAHLRATLAESMHQVSYTTTRNFTDNGTDIRVNLDAEDALHWSLQGGIFFADQEHPKSRLWLAFVHGLFDLALFGTQILLALLYWYTRTTTHGLSWRAQWISIACNAVQVFYRLNQTSKEDWISFHTAGKTLRLGCLVASALLKVTTLLHIELERGRITRRPASKKERDTRRLDDKIGWLPAAVLFGLHVAFFKFVKPYEVHILSEQGCESKFSQHEIVTARINWAFLNYIGPALGASSALIQAVFNAKSLTFAGSFKMVALSWVAADVLTISMQRLEFLSGWKASRPPLDLGTCLNVFVASITAYQALVYPGIPQQIAEDDDDDL